MTSPHPGTRLLVLAITGIALLLAPRTRLEAQRATDLRRGVSGGVVAAAASAHTSPPPSMPRPHVSAAPARRRWPWFALGGAVLGGATLAALTLLQCDAGCRDDGGHARGLVFAVPVGIVGGAGVGALLGLTIDAHARRGRGVHEP